jgi:hypothetical protein
MLFAQALAAGCSSSGAREVCVHVAMTMCCVQRASKYDTGLPIAVLIITFDSGFRKGFLAHRPRLVWLRQHSILFFLSLRLSLPTFLLALPSPDCAHALTYTHFPTRSAFLRQTPALSWRHVTVQRSFGVAAGAAAAGATSDTCTTEGPLCPNLAVC